MVVRIKQFAWTILMVLSVSVLAGARQEPPLETVRIDTNLVVLRITASDLEGRAAVTLKQDSFNW